MERLEQFAALVTKWNPRINLVAKSTIADIRVRHICDSAQLAMLGADPENWLDIGSGGGFPGIVIAIMLKSMDPSARMTLVESDHRKSVFLKTVTRELSLSTVVLASRVEELDSHNATTLSARALAPLPKLLEYASLHLHPAGTALFQKGETWEKEVQEARRKWLFDLDVISSSTSETAVVLKVANIRRSA